MLTPMAIGMLQPYHEGSGAALNHVSGRHYLQFLKFVSISKQESRLVDITALKISKRLAETGKEITCIGPIRSRMDIIKMSFSFFFNYGN